MNTSIMKCPKCSYPRDGEEQCPSCGIVFSKYAIKRRRLDEFEYQQIAQREEKQRQLLKKLGAAIVIVCVSVVVVVVVNFDNEVPTPQQSTSSSRQLTNPYSQNSSKKLLDDSVKGQVAHATFKVRNSKISHPKGSSTSFLITRSCYALTDSYISKMPSSSNSSIKSRIDSVDQRISNLSAQLEERRQNFINTCSDCSKETYEKATKNIKDKIESAAKERERIYLQMPSTAETLSANFNNNSYSLEIIERNEGLGVSLLHINSNTTCEPVTIGNSTSLKPGDEIFMMGPSGRVADGVVTGFTTSNSGHGLITHTASAASIDGLLGTPLFNKNGEVLGINVNGIGNERYALRIEEVLEEFGIVP